MGINVIDVVIVLLILCGGVVGFKRGFFKELVMTIGYVILIAISLVLKTPIAEFLALHLPFFNFSGSFEGLVVFNILLYQILSFIIVFAILSIVFNVILSITKVFEKILNATIILGFFSKLLGFFLGLINGYIIVFIICFFLSFPIFNQTVVADSKLKNRVMNSTPFLSNISKDMTITIDEIEKLVQTGTEDEDEFNRQAIAIMLRHEMVSKEHIGELIEKGKIKTPGIEEMLK